MKATVIFSVQLIFWANCINAQELAYGSCPRFNVVKNFDIHKYLGTWYEYSNYFARFQAFGDCVKAEYSDETQPDGTPQIGVINQSVSQLTGNSSAATGEAVLAEPNNPEKPAKLIVNFDRQPVFTRSTTANYNVIDTDYKSYSIVYTCKEEQSVKKELLWILTRERNPPQKLIRRAEYIIRGRGLDTSRLLKITQVGCTN